MMIWCFCSSFQLSNSVCICNTILLLVCFLCTHICTWYFISLIIFCLNFLTQLLITHSQITIAIHHYVGEFWKRLSVKLDPLCNFKLWNLKRSYPASINHIERRYLQFSEENRFLLLISIMIVDCCFKVQLLSSTSEVESKRLLLQVRW